jgi:hypothetical protein
MVDRPGGLAWLAAFGAEHGKRISLPEWGLTTRHPPGVDADDPGFVAGVHQFIVDHDVLYDGYFDHTDDDETWSLRSGEFPEAAAVYRQLFGAPDGAPGGG